MSAAFATRVRPSLGSSVSEVYAAFRGHHDGDGSRIVQAFLVGPPQRCYRWDIDGRLGVSGHDGLTLRRATTREVDEFDEGLANGWVQIVMFDRLRGTNEVLHQATGRQIPVSHDEPPSAAPRSRG